MIEATNGATALVRALIREVYAAGAKPFVQLRDTAVERSWRWVIRRNSSRCAPPRTRR